MKQEGALRQAEKPSGRVKKEEPLREKGTVPDFVPDRGKRSGICNEKRGRRRKIIGQEGEILPNVSGNGFPLPCFRSYRKIVSEIWREKEKNVENRECPGTKKESGQFFRDFREKCGKRGMLPENSG